MHHKKGNENDERLFYADRIKFYSSNQNIVLNNGNQRLSFSRLRINSQKKVIELDSCYVFNKKNETDFNQFSGYFDKLHFSNVDFLKLTRENIMKADSVYCINPRLELQTTIKEKDNNRKGLRVGMGKDSLAYNAKYLLGDIDIKYIGVDNASLSLLSKKNDKISKFSIKRTDFSMNEVIIINRPEVPIQIGKFDIGLAGYEASDRDSTYIIKFDSIHFINDQLSLVNFSVTPSYKTKNRNKGKDIFMKSFAIKNISWGDLIANGKLVAKEIDLIEPVVNITAPPQDLSRSTKKEKTVFQLIQNKASLIDVEHVTLYKGSVNYIINEKSSLRVENLNANINVNQFLQSVDYNKVLS
jgi:hypothetical protein